MSGVPGITGGARGNREARRRTGESRITHTSGHGSGQSSAPKATLSVAPELPAQRPGQRPKPLCPALCGAGGATRHRHLPFCCPARGQRSAPRGLHSARSHPRAELRGSNGSNGRSSKENTGEADGLHHTCPAPGDQAARPHLRPHTPQRSLCWSSTGDPRVSFGAEGKRAKPPARTMPVPPGAAPRPGDSSADPDRGTAQVGSAAHSKPPLPGRSAVLGPHAVPGEPRGSAAERAPELLSWAARAVPGP